MPTHHKRFRDQWELENQKRLEKFLQVSHGELRKQCLRTLQATSFLVYLHYKSGRVLFQILTGLWDHPEDLDRRLEHAEQQRLKLRSEPGNWLK